jgi:hypothetical protein
VSEGEGSVLKGEYDGAAFQRRRQVVAGKAEGVRRAGRCHRCGWAGGVKGGAFGGRNRAGGVLGIKEPRHTCERPRVLWANAAPPKKRTGGVEEGGEKKTPCVSEGPAGER